MLPPASSANRPDNSGHAVPLVRLFLQTVAPRRRQPVILGTAIVVVLPDSLAMAPWCSSR